jgi:citrate lyase synthetase
MKNSTTQSIEILNPIQLALVNKFYKANGARGKAKGNERVWVVKQQQIIAAARIADISGCDFLTGVQVDKALTGNGIATRLIVELLKCQQDRCFTFPYTHLSQWYERLGFVKVASIDLPKPLQMRFERYKGQGRDIVCMVKGND